MNRFSFFRSAAFPVSLAAILFTASLALWLNPRGLRDVGDLRDKAGETSLSTPEITPETAPETHDEGSGEHGGHESGHGAEGGHDDHDEEAVIMVSDASLRRSGVRFEPVTVRRLALRLPLQGRILLNEDRTAHLHARFPGVIVEVRKSLGAVVRKGDVLARIESNESLEPYSLTARKDGVVIGRHAAVGESVTPEDELFTVSDLSEVWVDFQVYRQEFSRLRAGQQVRVSADGLPPAETRLAYLSPRADAHSQSLLARATLPNGDGRWTPGLFVQGEAAVETFEARAVPRAAVQTVEGVPAVFVREAEGRYRAHPVKTGRRDGEWLELLEGPAVGAEIAVSQSYLLKAELGKGAASHEH